MLIGSGATARNAATIAKIKIANLRFLVYTVTSTMPMRSRNSMMSGVWKAAPKISGTMTAKLSHSLNRSSGSTPSHSLKPSR